MAQPNAAGLHSLTTIIKRLEAATTRIEDLAEASFWPARAVAAVASQPPAPATQSAPSPSPASASAPLPPAKTFDNPQSILAYDEAVIVGKLNPFLELTRSFASKPTIEAAALVEKQFNDLRIVLLTSAHCKKPDDKAFDELTAAIKASPEAINKIKDAHWKDREWENHLNVLAGGSPAPLWPLSPTPAPHVAETKESVDYYGNKIIKDLKDKDPRHRDWVRAYMGLLEELKKYVVEYYKMGLTWNPKGMSVSDYTASSGSRGATSVAPPPPPPPPGPPPPPVLPAAAAAPSGLTGTAAVFAELNKGSDITKGLRKVDKSEMTHKNPELRASSVVPSSVGSGAAPKKPLKPSKPQALMGKKPSKLALEGRSWAVEYYEDEKSLVLDNCEISQAVNIFGCKNSVIMVKGKVNAVTLVNCVKTSVVVDSVVSQISVTKSPSFELQVMGSAPMIQLDSTDSGNIYLSKGSLGVEITTAKCSAINITLPPKEGEEDYLEQAVPEMFKTVIENGKLVTTVVEHTG